jgi:hypothetical protein
MILVTKRRQIGAVCGHAIYSIEESQLITVPHPSVQTEVSHSKVELRLAKTFCPILTLCSYFWVIPYRCLLCAHPKLFNYFVSGCAREIEVHVRSPHL